MGRTYWPFWKSFQKESKKPKVSTVSLIILSIDQKDVIAFGDEHNDFELLDYAGWGVAMNNGTDQFKGIGNDVTPMTNQEDGLAVYLEDLLAL